MGTASHHPAEAPRPPPPQPLKIVTTRHPAPVEATRPTPATHSQIYRPPFRPVILFDNRMVFNFFRPDNLQVRTVVSMRDITENGTKGPSWTKLLEILGEKEGLFDVEKDFMVVAECVVQGEREFLAALQWASNLPAQGKNFVVSIYKLGERVWG
ncbi:uncharacterized protein LAJ45_09298 [Morchella importuna]|uniref:Uncharacterized protein n=1 Tax=Morchella conica CCBAS932 TaxID=1392247 RepID=A0A3N4KF09_9PEZI|nr:uncharacterized protein LAJ45_09298 [Morchella importuna]KAH8146615.1 hypothetical protein LAJ45_09298 [Morchella importuna]RPB09070.1 hypothetical protein P167DRAFT_538851 [Morchella conica CCBAS932]